MGIAVPTSFVGTSAVPTNLSEQTTISNSAALLGLGPPSPPCKKLQIELAKEAVYRISHGKVRLGGWGSEDPKGPTLGRHVSSYATIHRLRTLLYLRASH